jgi:hypothetical protein
VETARPQVDVEPSVDESTDDDPRHAHIVTPAAAVTEAMINGTPVTALCGYTWVPSRDPDRYPLCQRCKAIHAQFLVRGGN